MRKRRVLPRFILHPSAFILTPKRYLSVALSVGLAPLVSLGGCSAWTLSSTVPCAVRTFLAAPGPASAGRARRGRLSGRDLNFHYTTAELPLFHGRWEGWDHWPAVWTSPRNRLAASSRREPRNA